MTEPDQEFTETILHLPDEEIQRIAASTQEEYRPEAIMFAQSVLRARGLEPLPPAPVETGESTKKPVVLRLLLLAMAGVVVVAGLQFAIRSYFSTPTYDPKLGSVLAALLCWSAWGVLTFLIRRDPEPSVKAEVRWWVTLLAAVVSTFVALGQLVPAKP